MLNIKNPRAHELAVEVASVTGESLTDAVIHALEERKARLRIASNDIDMAKVEAILGELKTRLPKSFFEEEDPSAFLYDPDTGLPT